MNSVSGLEQRIAGLKERHRAERSEREKDEEREKEVTDKESSIGTEQTARKEEDDEEAGTDYLEAYLYYLRQRAYPNDSMDLQAFPNAVAVRDALPAAQISAPVKKGGKFGIESIGGSWEFVGPNNLAVPYQIYYGQSILNGRMNATAYDPSNPSTYYIGTAGGGFWRSTDSGSTWTPLSDTWKGLQVSSIAIHPTDSRIIYVGTGDFPGYGNQTYGIMRTKDGGYSWTNIGNSQFGSYCVSDIVIDPENPQIILAATGRGPSNSGRVWRSTDGGDTWTSVLNTTTPWSSLSYSLKDGNGVRNLYAVGHGNPGQVYRSQDRGASWTSVRPSTTLMSSISHDSLQITASATDPNTVYLLVGDDRRVLKSTDAGATWANTTNNFPNGNGSVGTNYNWSQQWYDAHIHCSTRTVSGVTTDAVYVGLIDVAMSPDGGATWQSVGGPTYVNASLLHNDQHCLAINPANPNECLVGNDGGIYRFTYNPSANTWSYTSLNTFGNVTQFYKMALHPTDPTRILGGAQDNASPVATGNLSTWGNVVGGDGGFCAILNNNVQYGEAQNMALTKTTNGWATSSGIRPSTGSDTVAFIAPFALASDGSFFYAGTNYLYKRNETTNTWTNRVGAQVLAGSGSYVQYIGIAPSDNNRIYTGSSDGQLWMTTDAGTTWTQINTGASSLPNRAITYIVANPTNPSDVWVTLSGSGTSHVYHCTDTTAGAGRVWQNVSGTGANTLPDISTNAIALDTDNPTTTWYVGTDVGVFMTTDSGNNWANATVPLGLPNVQVNDLKMNPNTRYLYAATYGRGIWRIQVPATVRQVSGTVNLQGLSASAPSQQVTIQFRPSSGTAFSRTVTLAADGSFTCSNIPSGSYNLAIKGSKWLQKVVAADATSGNVSGITVTLPAGDINNDNAVSVADYSIWRGAFGSTPGSANWDPRADVNCDGAVTVADYALWKGNYPSTGDP
jgi:photosystem II stability/assembly factor-like uncharacterized protein